MTEPLALRYADVAAMLSMSVNSVQRLVAAGSLRAVGRGAGRRVVAESLRQYLAGSQPPPRPRYVPASPRRRFRPRVISESPHQ